MVHSKTTNRKMQSEKIEGENLKTLTQTHKAQHVTIRVKMFVKHIYGYNI